MIVDTNILIDFLKGKEEAIAFVELNQPISVSVIVVSELYSGVQNDDEIKELTSFLSHVEQVEVSSAIALKAGLLRRKFHKSHGVEIPDAIIAATAENKNVPVATLDKKHFSVLTKNLIIPY